MSANEWYRVKNQKATGAVAIASTLAPEVTVRVLEVRLHLSAAVSATEDLTITLDAIDGAAYDTNLLTEAMNGVQDLVWRPNAPLIIEKGDEMDVAFANTDTLTYGLEIVYQEI